MTNGGKIEVVCTRCQTTLLVAASSAGKKGRCPKCQEILAVPESRGRDSGAENFQSDEELALACPHCDGIIPPASLVADIEQRCERCGGGFQVPDGFNPFASTYGRGEGSSPGSNAESNGEGPSGRTDWTDAENAFRFHGHGPVTAAIEVEALGGMGFWKFAVELGGVEHDLSRGKKRLIPVPSGAHSLEFFVRSFGTRTTKNQISVSVADGMVQPVSYKALTNPAEQIRHRAYSVVSQGTTRRLTEQEARSLGIPQ